MHKECTAAELIQLELEGKSCIRVQYTARGHDAKPLLLIADCIMHAYKDKTYNGNQIAEFYWTALYRIAYSNLIGPFRLVH